MNKKNIWHIFISFGVLILIWQMVVSIGNFNESLFPAPLKVIKEIVILVKQGTLLISIKESLIRFFIGYGLAIISAIVLGLIMGCNKKLWEYINPIIQFLRPISPIAWMPFIVILFGIGNVPAILIIFIAGFFPILLSTVKAVGQVDKLYLKVADNFALSKIQTLTKIIVPSALPSIMTGIHLALGTAWIFLVAGEMVGAQSGLGYMIIDARNNLRMDILLASIVIIGFIGVILDSIIGTLEKNVLKKY